MAQVFADPDEANLDHLLSSDDPIISAFTRWLMTEARPDDWHLVIQGWNWDAGEDPVWWIITRPDCDKATALLVFWKAGPHHYLGHPPWETVDLEDFDLYHTIRQRWAAGFYVRSTLAFDVETDVEPVDVQALRATYGDAVEAAMPQDMRRLDGRRLEGRGYVQGIPAHLWSAGLDDEDFDPFALEDEEEAEAERAPLQA